MFKRSAGFCLRVLIIGSPDPAMRDHPIADATLVAKEMQALAPLVLPVSCFSLLQPLNRSLQAPIARFFCPGLGYPLHIFLFVAVGKTVECRCRFLALFDGLQEIIGNGEFLLDSARLRLFRNLDSVVMELFCLFYIAEQDRLGGQILERRDAPELPHAVGGFVVCAVQDQAAFPEPEGAMLFEACHAAQNSFVHEVRKAPLDGLFHLRAALMNNFAQVAKNGLGEFSRFGNVGVNTFIFAWHGGRYCLYWTGARQEVF